MQFNLHYVFSKKFISTPHCVNIASNLDQWNWILDKQMIIQILEKDEVKFQKRGMRIFDRENNVFYKLGDDFRIEVERSNPKPILLLLRSPDISIKKRRFDELENKISELQNSIVWLKSKIISTPSRQGSRIIQEISSEQEEEKQDSFSELMDNNVGRAKSKTFQATEELSNSRSHSSYQSVTLMKNISGMSGGTTPSLKKFHSVNYSSRLELVNEGLGSHQNAKKGKLDIAILYSDPLVRRNQKNGSLIPLDDPVNFESECIHIKKSLDSLEKEIHMTVEIATVSNLLKVLEREPTILHFICHGDYSKEQQKFYLAFENQRAELEECDTNKLQEKILANIKSTTNALQMVFVNACHSEEVGKVFSEAGVPAVIAVQSELKIEDKVALEFAEQFYHQVFKGHKICESVRIARNNTQAIQDRNVFTCCCAHRHKANCKWYQAAINDGFGEAHNLHIHKCGCEKAHQHIHRSNCNWVNYFLMEYANEDDLTFGGTSEIFACCCAPDLTHDETMKFLEIYRDEREGNFSIFPSNLQEGELKDSSSWEIGNAKFSGIKIIGRNWQIHRLFELLTSKQNRLVQVSGEAGVGKTSLVQQTANYLLERNHFRDNIFYINLEKVKSLSTFLNKLKLDYESLEKMCTSLNSKSILFILDNCDMIIKDQQEKFTEKLSLVINSTKYIKFVICTQVIHKLKVTGFQALTLSALDEIDAFRLLCHFTGDQYAKLIFNGENLVKELLTLVKRTPKSLWTVAENIREKKNLKLVLDDLEDEIQPDDTEDNGYKEIGIALKNLSAKNNEAHDFLLFLCEFPSGITTSDLQIMSEEQNLLDKKWKLLLHFLVDSVEEENLQRSRSETANFGKIRNSEIEAPEIKQGHYYWFKVLPTDYPNSLIIKVHQYIANYSREKVAINPSLCFKSLSYIRCLTQILIEKMKKEKIYSEKIVECSQVSEEGLWESKEYAESNLQLVKSLSQHCYYETFQAEKILAVHETNLLSVLELNFKEIFKNLQNEHKGKLVHILLTIFRNLPTIFKMLSRFSEAREIAESVAALCEKPEIVQISAKEISLVKVQIQLFFCALRLEEHFQIMNSENWKEELESQIQIAEETMNEVSLNKYFLKLGEYELSLVKLTRDIILSVEKSTRKSKSDFSRVKLEKDFSRNNTSATRESICLQISKFKESLRMEHWDQQYPTLFSKFSILEAECKPFSKSLDEKIISDLKNAICHFKRMCSEYLELRANCALVTNVMNCGSDKILKEAKSIYCERALQLAISLKDNILEAESKELLDSINIEIRKMYSNLFVFMRSNPVVKYSKGKTLKTCSEFDYYNFNFRKELCQLLEKKRKKISLRLDVLSMEDFKKNVDFGSKILSLSFSEYKEGEIIFEGKNKEAERVAFENFAERVFGDSAYKITSVDILILAVPNCIKLAEFFFSMGIPRIVFFEFCEKTSFTQAYLQEIAMKEFSFQFTEEILEGNTIAEAFKLASSHMIQKMIEITSITDKNGFIYHFGKGPKMFPEDLSLHEVFPFEKTKIETGDLEDISRSKVPTNLKLHNEPFVGRNYLIYKALKALFSEESINIFGVHGSGKTAFAKIIADFCLSKSMFPNGVFFFPLKRLEKENIDLKGIMKEEFGEVFAKRIQMYFDKKKMLIVFDDFDILDSKKDIFADHIVSSLEECNIPYITITQERIEGRKMGHIECGSLSPEEVDLLLQTWTLIGPKWQNMDPWYELPIVIDKECRTKLKHCDRLPKTAVKIIKEMGIPKRFTQESVLRNSERKQSRKLSQVTLKMHKKESSKKKEKEKSFEEEKQDEFLSFQNQNFTQTDYEPNNSIDSKEFSIAETKSNGSNGSDTISKHSSTSFVKKLGRGSRKLKKGKKRKHQIYGLHKNDKYFTHIAETQD